MIDIDTYLAALSVMPTCLKCGAANSGNITCRECRQVNREVYEAHGWPTDFLDLMDEINPELAMPVGVEEVRRFMGRLKSHD